MDIQNITNDKIEKLYNMTKWRDFRKNFSTMDEALKTHAQLCQANNKSNICTHIITWRLIYDSKTSMLRQFFSLFLLPLGIFRFNYTNFSFNASHNLTNNELKKIYRHKMLKSFCYNLNFALLFFSCLAIFAPVIKILMNGVGPQEIILAFAVPMAIIGLILLSNKTKSVAIPDFLKREQKGIFELESIRPKI